MGSTKDFRSFVSAIRNSEIKNIKELLDEFGFPEGNDSSLLHPGWWRTDMARIIFSHAAMVEYWGKMSQQLATTLIDRMASEVSLTGLISTFIVDKRDDSELVPPTIRQAILDGEYNESMIKDIENLGKNAIVALCNFIDQHSPNIDNSIGKAIIAKIYSENIIDKPMFWALLGCYISIGRRSSTIRCTGSFGFIGPLTPEEAAKVLQEMNSEQEDDTKDKDEDEDEDEDE